MKLNVIVFIFKLCVVTFIIIEKFRLKLLILIYVGVQGMEEEIVGIRRSLYNRDDFNIVYLQQ